MAAMDLIGPEDFCSEAAITLSTTSLVDRNSRLKFNEANDLFTSYCGIIGCRERLERYSMECLDVSMYSLNAFVGRYSGFETAYYLEGGVMGLILLHCSCYMQ